MSPSIFYQLFVVLAERRSFHSNICVTPIFYILLPNKTGQTYKRMFRYINDIWPNLDPSSISCDFEKGLHNAIDEVFPDARIFGCYFHLCQAMRTHVGQLGLKRLYDTDSTVNQWCRMIPVILFLFLILIFMNY